jgi:hypothetical protein
MIEEISSEIALRQRERNLLDAQIAFTDDAEERIKSHIDKLQTAASGDIYQIRAEIACRLKTLVRHLYVAPSGGEPFRENFGKKHGGMADHDWSILSRYLAIVFKDGTARMLIVMIQIACDSSSKSTMEIGGKGMSNMWTADYPLPFS